MIDVLNELIDDFVIETGRQPDDAEVRYLARAIVRARRMEEST